MTSGAQEILRDRAYWQRFSDLIGWPLEAWKGLEYGQFYIPCSSCKTGRAYISIPVEQADRLLELESLRGASQ